MSRSGWDDDTLNRVYDKTEGYCYYCGKSLAWKNYGVYGARAAWQVDHSVPLSLGGTDHLNNLVPACIGCNLQKGTQLGRNFKRQFQEPAASSGWTLGEFALGVVAVLLIASLLGGKGPR